MSAIFFDLDGTLAPVGQPVPESVAEGLRQLEQRGHLVAICSGKPLFYLCGMMRQVGLSRPALIGENGAAMQIGIDLPPMIRGILPYPDGAAPALAAIKQSIDSRYSGQVWYQPNEHMLTCFPHEENLFDPIAELIAEHATTDAGLVVYRHCDCFDIIPRGVDKGAGLLELCRMMDLNPADTIAVGDHDNDRPMFLAAGRSYGVGLSAPSESMYRFDSVIQVIDHLLSM